MRDQREFVVDVQIELKDTMTVAATPIQGNGTKGRNRKQMLLLLLLLLLSISSALHDREQGFIDGRKPPNK
jgi:hypothetical protein